MLTMCDNAACADTSVEGAPFAELVARALDAKRHLPHEKCVSAGPVAFRVAFDSQDLATAYTRALKPSSAAPEWSIDVVTGSNEHLAALVPHPVDQGRAFGTGHYFAMWHPDEAPVLYLVDLHRQRGLIWLPKGRAPDWELSRPFCPLIQAFLSSTSWTVVHAASVGLRGRSLLLAGPGRAGKSTAALSCALAGWDYAGDDYICAQIETGEVLPLYSSARLRIDMAHPLERLLPTSVGISVDGIEQRHELRLAEFLGEEQIKGGTLKAILLPRRTGAIQPTFSPARPADVLHALFRTTMIGISGSLGNVAMKLSKLATLAPATFVDTGTQPLAIPDALAAFLDGSTSNGL
jgi:hypothetical protein